MTENSQTVNFRRYGQLGALVALIGLGVLAIGFFGAGKREAVQAYFYGWFFWAMLTLGCLGLNFLHHTLRGAWGLSVIRLVEAGSSWVSLLVTALAFIPIFIFRAEIYPWAGDPETMGHVLHNRLWYLNDRFFLIRFVLYFAVWMWLSQKLRKSSQLQDETLDPQL
jgi:hypothetical protein